MKVAAEVELAAAEPGTVGVLLEEPAGVMELVVAVTPKPEVVVMGVTEVVEVPLLLDVDELVVDVVLIVGATVKGPTVERTLVMLPI